MEEIHLLSQPSVETEHDAVKTVIITNLTLLVKLIRNPISKGLWVM